MSYEVSAGYNQDKHPEGWLEDLFPLLLARPTVMAFEGKVMVTFTLDTLEAAIAAFKTLEKRDLLYLDLHSTAFAGMALTEFPATQH